MATPTFSDSQENILSLAQADDMFQSRKGPGIVDESLKTLILTHGLADKFGVILVHRHARLKQGEAMVSYKNTSSPWPSQARAPCGGSVIPQAWRMKDGKLQPYEYRFVPSRAGLQDALNSHSSFVTEFADALERHNLSDCAGLSLVPECGKEYLEITVSSTNIMIPTNELQPGAMELDSTETMWFFDSNNGSKKFKCMCAPTVKGPHKHFSSQR